MQDVLYIATLNFFTEKEIIKSNIETNILINKIKIIENQNDYFKIDFYKNYKDDTFDKNIIYKEKQSFGYSLNETIQKEIQDDTSFISLSVISDNKDHAQYLVIQAMINYIKEKEQFYYQLNDFLTNKYRVEPKKSYNAAMKEVVYSIYKEIFGKDITFDEFLVIANDLPKDIYKLSKTFTWENELVKKQVRMYLKSL